MDVKAGSELVAHTRIVLKESSEQVPAFQSAKVTPVREGAVRQRKEWFAWLRPAFAAPAMALLLIVVGYQAVILQQQARRAEEAQLLPPVSLHLQSYGSNTEPLKIHPGQGFLLNVIVAPGQHYPAYRVDLLNPAGAVEKSLSVGEFKGDTWSISIPGANR